VTLEDIRDAPTAIGRSSSASVILIDVLGVARDADAEV
jgi:hypothetical protein